MAYGNYNNGDVKTLSAHFVDRPNRDGGKSKYFSFTMEIAGKMYTFRVYADSTYTPTSGKNKDKLSCPVRVQRWEKSRNNGGGKW